MAYKSATRECRDRKALIIPSLKVIAIVLLLNSYWLIQPQSTSRIGMFGEDDINAFRSRTSADFNTAFTLASIQTYKIYQTGDFTKIEPLGYEKTAFGCRIAPPTKKYVVLAEPGDWTLEGSTKHESPVNAWEYGDRRRDDCYFCTIMDFMDRCSPELLEQRLYKCETNKYYKFPERDTMKSEKKDASIPEKDETKDERMKRVLHRSKKDKIIAGVFGGLAEYLSVDPVLLRIIGVILFFARPGEFIIIYIAAAIIMPEEKDGQKPHANETDGRLFIGGALVILGIIFLLQKYITWFNWDYLWPFIIIGIGAYLLVRK